MRITASDRTVLKLVADGEYLSFNHLSAVSRLEAKGLIETVKTSFISQVTLRVTEAGRAALALTRPKCG